MAEATTGRKLGGREEKAKQPGKGLPTIKRLAASPLLGEPSEKELEQLKLGASYASAKRTVKDIGEKLVQVGKALEKADSDDAERGLKKERLQWALDYVAAAEQVDLLAIAVILDRMKRHGYDQEPYKSLHDKAVSDYAKLKANFQPGQFGGPTALAFRRQMGSLVDFKDLTEALADMGLKDRLALADAAKEGKVERDQANAKLEEVRKALAAGGLDWPELKSRVDQARSHYAAMAGLLLARSIARLDGHTGGVGVSQISPDGTLVASASFEDGIKVWDVAQHREIASIKDGSDIISLVGFIAGGKELLAITTDRQGKNVRVKKWDARTGKELDRLKHISDWIYRMSQDGKLLAGFSLTGEVCVLDVAGSKPKTTFKGLGGSASGLALAPDGKYVAGANMYWLRVWDTAAGKELWNWERPGVDYVLAFSPDGKKLSAGSAKGDIITWDAATGGQLLKFKGHPDRIAAVSYSPDGKYLATAGWDKTVKIWDSSSGAVVMSLTGHTEVIYSANFNSNGKRLVTSSFDKTVRIWDLDLD